MDQTVGGYELLGRVASGSTSSVWKARDPALGRFVALKQVPSSASDQVDRMRVEASVLASLADEHVVEVYGFIEEGGSAYLVEQWIDGATLAAMIAGGARPDVAQSLGVVRGALLGLDHAHGRGVVHGDVSTSNVIVDTEGVSRLIDFGQGGRGTPAYRSPEVAAGHPATTTSDVYAAAAVLTHLLTGSPAAASVGRTDPGLQPVLRTAMDVDPQARHQDAGTFLAALAEAAEETYGSRWWTQAGVGALVPPAVAGLTGLGGGSASIGIAATPAAGSHVPLIAGITTAGALVVGGLVVAATAFSKDEPTAAPSSAPTSVSSSPLAGGQDDVPTDPLSSPDGSATGVDPVVEAARPSGTWRVVTSGVDVLHGGTRQEHTPETGTWKFRDGDCDATGCAGSVRDSVGGGTYDVAWDGTTFVIDAPVDRMPKTACIDDETGKTVPIAEAAASSVTTYDPRPFRVTAVDDTGAPTGFSGGWSYVVRWNFFGTCRIAPDTLVSGRTTMTLTRIGGS